MRIAALSFLLFCGSVSAATLDVTVTEKHAKPVRYSFALDGTKHKLDLRDAARYTVAVKDEVRNKEICREAEYRTGLLLSLNDISTRSTGEYVVEVIGQISDLSSLETTGRLSCGANQKPLINHRAFSDTSSIEPGKSKVLVIDGNTTLLLSINE